MNQSKVLLTIYVLLIVAAVTTFLAIRQVGETLEAPPAPTTADAAVSKSPEAVHVVLHVLATLAAVIGVGNLLALGLRRIGQPAVIGEVIAGIVLGPSVLGAISPDAMHWLIPDATLDPHGLVVSSLKTISQIGVVLYMFIVGLELNTQKVGKQASAAIAISHASIVLPFVLGAGLGLWLYPRLSYREVPFTSFALFQGAAMAITAFPVLARILTDCRLEKTDLGVLALSCAATDDVTAWCLLALVVGVVQAQVAGALMVVAWSLGFIAMVFLVARPLMKRLIIWGEPRGLDRQVTPWLFILVLVAALTTEWIGVHAVFGAFLIGAIIPHDSRIALELSRKLYDVVTILLLPAFFAITGMNTRINLISGWEGWLVWASSSWSRRPENSAERSPRHVYPRSTGQRRSLWAC